VAEVGKVDPVGVVDEDDKRLAEEQGQDREVVAEKSARRQPHEEPQDRSSDHDDRNCRHRLPVVAELRRREDGIEIRADTEERDVAEIQQSGKADDDVETERKQCVDEREQSVPENVPLAREEWKGGGRCREHEDPGGGR